MKTRYALRVKDHGWFGGFHPDGRPLIMPRPSHHLHWGNKRQATEVAGNVMRMATRHRHPVDIVVEPIEPLTPPPQPR